jgi:thimet oligopeptidase
VTETVEDFERNGFALTPEKRTELQKINDRISELSLSFGDNIAAHKDYLLVTEAEMQGVPEDYKKARPKEGDRYRIGLDGPAFSTFMKYAASDDACKRLFVKYNNRAADQDLTVLQQVLLERQKKARLLGYPTYAAYQTSSRMAKTPETVWDFETKLVNRVKQKTAQDVQELLAVKRAALKDPAAATLNPWEVSYYNELLMKDKYQLEARATRATCGQKYTPRTCFRCSKKTA